jgi:hypothetical protein
MTSKGWVGTSAGNAGKVGTGIVVLVVVGMVVVAVVVVVVVVVSVLCEWGDE